MNESNCRDNQKPKKVFDYRLISFKEHMLHIWGIVALCGIVIIGGIVKNAPVSWILIFVGFEIYLLLSWVWDYRQENSFSPITVFEDGLSYLEENKELFFLWGDIEKVQLLGKQDSVFKQRPGLLIKFNNGKSVFVLQKVRNFNDLYRELATHGIKGTDDEIKRYKLDRYGRILYEIKE